MKCKLFHHNSSSQAGTIIKQVIIAVADYHLKELSTLKVETKTPYGDIVVECFNRVSDMT